MNSLRRGLSLFSKLTKSRYNSAFFTTIPVNAYTWAAVTPEFLTGTPFNITATNDTLTERAALTVQWLPPSLDEVVNGTLGTPGDVTTPSWDIEETLLAWKARSLNDTIYTKLEPLECLEAYVTQFGNASDVLIISSTDMISETTIPQTSNSFLAAGLVGGLQSPDTYWECSFSNTFKCTQMATWRNNASIVANWNVFGYEVDYCLSISRDTSQGCSVQVSFTILLGKS